MASAQPRRKRAWGDVVSSTNIVLGALALMFVLDGSRREYNAASALFFVILALDGIDGTLAKRTRQSPIGAYLDSVSDSMGFVLLPCMLLYSIHYTRGISGFFYFPNAAIVLTIIAYISAGLYRLARFAVMPPSDSFKGAPVSLPSILVVSLIGLEFALTPLLLVLLFSIPLLLSPVPFPKIKRLMLVPATLAVLSGTMAFVLMGINSGAFKNVGQTLLLVPVFTAASYALSPLFFRILRPKDHFFHRQKVLNRRAHEDGHDRKKD